jgi:hypothetical protein
MDEYEIRVLTAAMQPTRSVYGMYENDDEAVLEARKCAVGKAVEVWRDSVCIFRAPADTANSVQVP